MLVYVTRKVHFNAAHKLWNPNWSAEKNQAVFGACSNENWHGHNYVLEVTVAGEPDPDTGYVIDLKHLRDILKQKVLSKVDHKNLNLDVDFMSGKLTSSEHFAVEIWNQIEPEISTGQRKLYSVKLFETERNFVEYRGETASVS
jgi:6-pyruvoyltetrahydropterin/6-carboxytetrahydropterin synthase